MSEWQPIETAPKDGTGILVSFFNFNGLHSFIALAWYSESEEGWRAMSEHGYGPMDTVEPNFWMPLPAPPIKGNDNE